MYVFVSPDGVTEQQWRTAFATDLLVLPRWPAIIPDEAKMVWFRDDCVHLLDSIRYVRQQMSVPVVVMSYTPTVEASMPCFEAGAAGYCHAVAVPEMLVHVAESILAGGIWIGQDLMQQMVQKMMPTQPKSPEVLAASEKLSVLTPKEKQVALLVADGMSNKEVARVLEITDRTVKAHLSSVFDKLQVRDRLHLTLLIQHG
jgi:DNA-binding NarL/FixJ family response regulator